MPRSCSPRRKARPCSRRDAGHTLFQAIPPLGACAAIGVMVASGLLLSSPKERLVKESAASSSAAQHPSDLELDLTNNSDGIAEPSGLPYSPRDAERRGVVVSRDYEERLAGMAGRSAVPFHGVPGSDYTGDGNSDIMVPKPTATNVLDGTDPTGGFGAVEVWTLWSSSPVLTLSGPSQNDLFGMSAKSAGDLDGDGADDIVVGAMLEHGATGLEGAVEVYSGSDGAFLLGLYGMEWEYLGRTVAGASDADGDGQWDIAASSWVYDADGHPSGMVSVHSGSDGALIRTYTSELINVGFGYDVISTGDTDGDGDSEIAVTSPLAPGDPRAFAPATGRLHIFQGAPRAAHPEHLATSDAGVVVYNTDPLIDYFGVAIEITTDEDADGIADILVTSIIDPGTSQETTALQVYSSVTGAMLWPVSTPPFGTGSGRDDETFPSEDADGNIIHYSHYTSGLGVSGDASRDLKVEQLDMSLVLEAFGEPATPGNPVSGDLSLSGQGDLSDLSAVVGNMDQDSVVRDFVEDTNALLTRWSSLDPYQYGDYVTGDPGRGTDGSDGDRSVPSDPVYPFPRPAFPGYDSVSPIKDFGTHPTCPGCPGCQLCCAPGLGCGGIWDDQSGGPITPEDTNDNGIPDNEDCILGGTPPARPGCSDPCADANRNGVADQYDCDSPCYDDRFKNCDCIRADNFEGRPGEPYIACIGEQVTLLFSPDCPDECTESCTPGPEDWEYDDSIIDVVGGGDGQWFMAISASEPALADVSVTNGCCTVHWQIAFVDIALESVTFGGGNHTVHRDSDGSAFEGEWRAANEDEEEPEKRDPIAYTIGDDTQNSEKINVATVRFRAALPDGLEASDFKVTPKGTVNGDEINVDPRPLELQGEYLQATDIDLADCPSEIGWIEQLSVTWEITYQDEPTPCVNNENVSKNALYFTQNDPIAWPHYAENFAAGVNLDPALYHTVLHVACRGADTLSEDSTEQQLIEAIFNHLRTTAVRRAGDNVLFTFWADNVTPSYLKGGLADPDGDTQCTFWAELLFAAMYAHGHDHDNYTNAVYYIEPTWHAVYDIDVVGFVTPQAAFAPNGTAPPIADKDGNSWSFFTHTAGEVTLGPPIPGQGNTSPPQEYGNHFVLIYGNVIYDPSFLDLPIAVAGPDLFLEYEKRFAGYYYQEAQGAPVYYRKEVANDVECKWLIKYPEP